MTERQQSKLNSTSRFLSLILRHKPEAAGITLDEHGWADVGELIAGIRKTRDFDMELLKEIVKTDNKQRYSFSEDYTRIRANQGHSIPVDVELSVAEPPESLYHGTGQKYVESIGQTGLIPKSRVRGCRHRRQGRQPPWQSGGVSCGQWTDAEGRVCVLPVSKRCMADKRSSGTLFKQRICVKRRCLS